MSHAPIAELVQTSHVVGADIGARVHEAAAAAWVGYDRDAGCPMPAKAAVSPDRGVGAAAFTRAAQSLGRARSSNDAGTGGRRSGSYLRGQGNRRRPAGRGLRTNDGPAPVSSLCSRRSGSCLPLIVAGMTRCAQSLMLGEPTAKDRSRWERGVDGSRVSAVDGRGRSVSTRILYEMARAMSELPTGAVVEIRADVLPVVDSVVQGDRTRPCWGSKRLLGAGCTRFVRLQSSASSRRGRSLSRTPVSRSCCRRSDSLSLRRSGAVPSGSTSRARPFACLPARFPSTFPAGSARSAASRGEGSTRRGTLRRTRSSDSSTTWARSYTCADRQWCTSRSSPMTCSCPGSRSSRIRRLSSR